MWEGMVGEGRVGQHGAVRPARRVEDGCRVGARDVARVVVVVVVRVAGTRAVARMMAVVRGAGTRAVARAMGGRRERAAGAVARVAHPPCERVAGTRLDIDGS